MPLTDTAVKTLKPDTRPRKYADGGGLYLLVQPTGSKLWRLKYRFDGKEKLLALGSYPDTPLKAARALRDEAREMLAQGIDPGTRRKEEKAEIVAETQNTFEAIAREWFAGRIDGWAESHAQRIVRLFERDLFPWLGSRPIASITAPELLAVVRRIEGRGALDTAHRALQNCGQVFRYGVATGRCERDPAADLRGALPPARGGHFAAITDPAEVGALLRAIDAFKGTFVVHAALRLSPMVFVRPGELRTARWSDIDLERGEWRYFVTKTKTEHSVPLAVQAVAILRELQPLTGAREYVFPGARNPKAAMSGGAINAALRRMGYDTRTEITGHGFRAMARTIIAEELHERPEVIEHQLAHKVPDALGAAYNRTKFLKDRQRMMQVWADYLDRLKSGADVIQLHRNGTG